MLYEQFFAPVLVVDDEPLILRQMVEVMKAFGYFDVRQASSFAEAQEILEQIEVAALITDISLPDGDGRRLAADALKKNSSLRVVLISGFPTRSLMMLADLRAQVRLLEKPFAMNDLRAILDDLQEEFATITRIHP